MKKIFVALLRGINVGGHNKIAMGDLKNLFESLGYTNVETYLNTGNVIFHCPFDMGPSATNIEAAIETQLGLQIPTLILSYEKYVAICAEIPTDWKNDATMKANVFFLWDTIDAPDIVERVTHKTGLDTVKHVPGALLWSVSKKELTKSGLMKLAGTKIYKQMTGRNVNTTRKIFFIMHKTALLKPDSK